MNATQSLYRKDAPAECRLSPYAERCFPDPCRLLLRRPDTGCSVTLSAADSGALKLLLQALLRGLSPGELTALLTAMGADGAEKTIRQWIQGGIIE